MEAQFGGSALNQKTILSHPVGLFVLFFTEMWERFSYYGMRAILVLFLTSSIMNEGWAWSSEDALVLYGWYTGLVYLTPILGGFLADRYLGYRNATTLGALIMTLGHASMALETFTDSFFYLGLGLLVVGNGFFKPNISSIVGQLDNLKDTVDYVTICACVQEEMAVPAKLLEHVAKRIISRVFRMSNQIVKANVTVAKINPPIDGHVGSVAVTLEEERA